MISFPWLLSMAVGFLSLSQEVLWVRLVSFAYQGIPHAFSGVLALYLVGIALGALVGKRFCARSRDLYAVGAVTLLVAAVTDLTLPYAAGHFLSRERSSLPWLPLAIVATAGIKSVLFPIAHHLGSSQSGPRVGRSVSRIYFGNIIGSTLGPIVTGFYLLDHLTVEEVLTVIGVSCLALGAAMALFSPRQAVRASVAAVAVAGGLSAAWIGPVDAVSRMAVRPSGATTGIRHIIQNKHGIVHTVADDKRGDIVYGGNIYDGRVSVDMQVNSNSLERAYILAALHPKPRRVLVIGMSTGAWTMAVVGFPGVEHVDVVEINPAYLELIEHYSEVSALLTDPRVHIHVDDGRRWLKRHPDAQYDLIVQNTTYHWRANTTNLLSAEYFHELRRHMLPGAIAAINTTSSLDVYRTALAVFPAAFQFRNFVYSGDGDLDVPAETAMQRLRECRIAGRPAFATRQFEPGGIAHELSRAKLVPVAELLGRQPSLPVDVITDRNLLTEFRHGHAVGPQFLRWMWPENPAASVK